MNRRDAMKLLGAGAALAAVPAGGVDFDGPVRPMRDDVWIDVWLPPAKPGCYVDPMPQCVWSVWYDDGAEEMVNMMTTHHSEAAYSVMIFDR